MSINPLNDISRIYLEQVVESSHLETDMEKRRKANEKAIEDMKKTKAHKDMAAAARKKFDESKETPKRWWDDDGDGIGYEKGEVSGKFKRKKRKVVDEALRSREERMARTITPAKRKQQEKEREIRRTGEGVLADIQALSKGKASQQTPQYSTPDAEVRVLKPGQKKDTLALKAKKAMGEAKETPKRWWDDDGDGIGYEKGEVSGKFKKKKKSVKEGYSNWREDLCEIMDVLDKDENEQEITDKKKVDNTKRIKINPNMGEAVENLGGTLLEMVEIDEFDYIVESVYDELFDEGYGEDDIEEALEYALTEAKVTFGHDTAPEKKRSGLLAAAKQKLSGVKKAAKAAVASGARKVAKGALGVARKMEGGDKTPSATHTQKRKPSTYRGAGAGQKERVSSGSYQAPSSKPKPKSEPIEDPWKGSETTAKPKPATKPKSPAKPKPAAKPKTTKVSGGTTKKKRTSKLDDLLASVRSEQVQIDEKTLTSAETKKKEELVKSMKKSAGDFEERYPGRGKEVMYATATKMAKKIAEQALELQPKTQEKPDSAQKKVAQQQDRMRQQEVQILQRKLQALRSAPKGTDPSITAGYEPEGEMVEARYGGSYKNPIGRSDRDFEYGGSPTPAQAARQKEREDAAAADASAKLRWRLEQEKKRKGG